jgi:hypothetical protein
LGIPASTLQAIALAVSATVADTKDPSAEEQKLKEASAAWRDRLAALRGAAIVELAEPTSPIELPDRDPRARRLRRSWDPTERTLAWSYVGLGLADVYQTTEAPPDAIEANPFVSSWAGSHPDAAEVAVFKAAATWGLLHVTKRYVPSGKRRKLVLGLLNGLQLGVVLHNDRVLQEERHDP